MPEMTLTQAPIAAYDAPGVSAAWSRILLMTFYLTLTFGIVEHEFEFAGLSIATQDEEAVLDKNTAGAEEGNQLRSLMLIAFAGIGAVLLVMNNLTPWRTHAVGLTLILLLAAWAMMTVGWASLPSLALRRLIAWLCFVIGCFGVARVLSPREVTWVAMLSLAVMAMMSLAADLSAGAGPWVPGFRLSGTLHPNVQATYCATLCLAGFSLAYGDRHRFLCNAVWIGALALVFFTGSRTSLLATLIAMTAAWLLRQRGPVRALALGLGVMAVGMLVVCFYVLAPSDQNQLTGAALLGRTEKADSLSGRVPLWHELIGYASDRPIGGYGYDCFWTPGVMEDMLKSQDWSMTSAHNIYLETVLQIGLVGLALGLAATLLALALAKRRFDRTGDVAYQFFFGLFVYAMLNGLLEAHFLRPKYPTAIALMGVASLMLFREPSPAADERAEHERTPLLGGASA